MASDLATAEHDAMVKEAHLYGAAVADGAMARFAQWNDVLEKKASQILGSTSAPSTKTAGVDESFEKFAAENELLVKQAAEVGYVSTKSAMDKLAEEAYAKGYDQAVGLIHKTAHQAVAQGFVDAMNVLEALSK